MNLFRIVYGENCSVGLQPVVQTPRVEKNTVSTRNIMWNPWIIECVDKHIHRIGSKAMHRLWRYEIHRLPLLYKISRAITPRLIVTREMQAVRPNYNWWRTRAIPLILWHCNLWEFTYGKIGDSGQAIIASVFKVRICERNCTQINYKWNSNNKK